jgi:hypothetical protein
MGKTTKTEIVAETSVVRALADFLREQLGRNVDVIVKEFEPCD